MKKTQVSRACPGAHRLSKKIVPQSPEEAGTPRDRQPAHAGLRLPGEPRGCGGGWCSVRVRATLPGGSERSGSDGRESVSSLEPQQLSLELSVGNCIRWKGRFFGLGVSVITGKHVFARETVSRGSREIMKQLSTCHPCSLEPRFICAVLGGRGSSRGRGCSGGKEPNTGHQSGRALRGGEPARPRAETWLLVACA